MNYEKKKNHNERLPYESELKYFKQNPHVSGMATEDEKVIINPYSNLTDEQKQSVYQNESTRLHLRKKTNKPEFEITDKQKQFFKNYSDNPKDVRDTIIARIISGDESAGDVTEEQKKFASSIKKEMEKNYSTPLKYKEKYQQAKKSGYSDEDIMEFLSQKDPSFGEKMQKAQDSGYTGEEVLSFFNGEPNKEKLSLGDHAADFTKQGAQGFGIGSLGTYGDILDLFGLQAKETLPGEQAKYGREFDILEKEQKGETPSFSELMELSGDDDIAPRFSRFSSSKDVEDLGTKLNVVSEPKTPAGRYGRRIGKLAGGGASLGGTGIAAPIAAGVAGQTLEEFGAPPWAQAAAEIVAGLKVAPKANVPITSKSKEVEKIIGDLRKAGYSEKDITLAKSALEERKILKKYASLTPEAENAINSGVKNSENLFKEQIKNGLPGYSEGGLPYLEKQASKVYQTMEDLASTVPVKNTEPVRKSIQKAIDYLEKYPLLDEQKKFIEFLKDGLTKSDKANTAEFFTGFYRNLGKAGNWGDPKQKEHLLGLVKQGIKDTFEQSGPESAKFGKVFEKTNDAWKKWLDAKDLMQTIEKTQTVDGMNFKKLTSILNDPENHELAKKVLGPQQVQNIKSINQGAQSIESLLKQIPKTDKSIQSLKILEGIRSLLSGDYRPLAALITMEGARRLSTSLLTDPEKQNIMKKIISAAKNNSSQQAAILAHELIKTHSSQAKASEGQRQEFETK